MTAPRSTATSDGSDAVIAFRPCNVYRDVFGAWRWEYRDAHGEMRDSLDSFDSYHECIAAAQRVGLIPQT